MPSESGADDNALLSLERQFEVLAREFAVLLRTAANQNGEIMPGYGCGAGPANRSKGSCEARAGDEADKLAAERLERLEAALARLEPIERAIMAAPAQTVVGLGVKARHTAYIISEYWAEPLEKAEWDRRAVRLLIEAVCVVAGRPLDMTGLANHSSEVEHGQVTTLPAIPG
ncbi:hypothetical protein [Bradyrhizobium icense]|uniref:Uncharacterized protein n=1 Tax=Bradyrhizobium icense TaxID=1274631 RepID=A0A1B1UCP8_9BRAD|nr:hypothetical protein [Bradyrhizobium icense]ANW00456.1 hypothetical protein LMTR13_10040 [Bradyrhizobium icense]